MEILIDADLSPEALLRSLLPDFGAPRRTAAPLAGHCWKEPVPDSFCWKFDNSDPGARYDFWLLLTMRRLGPDAMTVSLVVPRDDGGLLHCVDTPVYERVVSTSLVQTLKQEHGSFGVVSVAKLKARVIYEETQRVLFGNRFLAARYDADGKLVEPYRQVEGLSFPPLPGGLLARESGGAEAVRAAKGGTVSVDTALSQIDLSDTVPLLSVYYPRYDVNAGGEIEVENGEVQGLPEDEQETGAAAAARLAATGGEDPLRARRPPGFYIDVTSREHPLLSLTVFSLQPEDGPGKILFADYCSGVSAHEIKVSIRVKKKKSFFKTKKKITIIRQELKKEGLVCGVLVDGGASKEAVR